MCILYVIDFGCTLLICSTAKHVLRSHSKEGPKYVFKTDNGLVLVIRGKYRHFWIGRQPVFGCKIGKIKSPDLLIKFCCIY